MMSKPAVHNVTAAVSHKIRGSSAPRMAIHAAAGAMPSENPSTRCDNEVKRLVAEQDITTASASGASLKHKGFNSRAAHTKIKLQNAIKTQAKPRDRWPAV